MTALSPSFWRSAHVEQSASEDTPMLMGFSMCDYIAASIAIGSVIIFIALLCWNGYDDYRNGRLTSTWRRPHE